MPEYSFEREDNGEIVTRFFKMGECPESIVLDNGVKAIRAWVAPYVSMLGSDGHAFGDGAAKLNAEMKSRQAAADKRMRERYKSCKTN